MARPEYDEQTFQLFVGQEIDRLDKIREELGDEEYLEAIGKSLIENVILTFNLDPTTNRIGRTLVYELIRSLYQFDLDHSGETGIDAFTCGLKAQYKVETGGIASIHISWYRGDSGLRVEAGKRIMHQLFNFLKRNDPADESNPSYHIRKVWEFLYANEKSPNMINLLRGIHLSLKERKILP